MSEERPISTWKFLQFIGFIENPDGGFSDIRPPLAYDFGIVQVEALAVMSKYLKPVVAITGIHKGPRTLGYIWFELPRTLTSTEEGAAWLALGLDQGRQGSFQPTMPLSWLETGRENSHLLPWPKAPVIPVVLASCFVEYDWAKAATKALGSLMAKEGAGDVRFHFDGTVFKIQRNADVIVFPAKGEAWAEAVTVEAANLTPLPARLSRLGVTVSVFETRLSIAQRSYSRKMARTEAENQTAPSQ